MIAEPIAHPAPAPEPEPPAEIPLSDPLQVFGAPGGPRPATPIAAADLDRAYARMLEAYPDEPGHASIRDAARRAHALTADPTRWTILADGAVQLTGSAGDTYHVTDDCCAGPRWYNRRTGQHTTICKGSIRASSSLCYHTLARELLRLAQALAAGAEEPVAGPPPVAIAIDGDELLAMFGFFSLVHRDDGDLLLQLDEHQITLLNGTHTVSIPAPAAGHVSLLIPPASFAALWPDIRRHARHAGPVQIRVGPDQITFGGGPLQISATITRI